MYPGLNNIYQSVISNTINYFDNHTINKDDVIQLGKINFEIFNYNGETVDFFIKKH